MQIASVRGPSSDRTVLVDESRGLAFCDELDPTFRADVTALLDDDVYRRMADRAATAGDELFHPADSGLFTAPYRSPRKIWGIGLNYRDHASDLSESIPEEPASFMRGDHTIIGAGDTILLPEQSKRVTAEAEIGLVIGKYCRNVSEDEALDYVWGVCPILDQTAEDILQRNPRFLTRSKNFPTFFSFGPTIVPMQEVRQKFNSIEEITVSTVKNGQELRTNTVAHMTFGPAALVSFHSKVMPLFPGDIISTGTPGAVVLDDGDIVECRIPGIGNLVNHVRREK
ncbi:fumarylacetoacetate hydrolase family protein [Streptomyces sp. NPDC001982]|uniref:fumarylacetoacetate hydrolase family protein n=1 Tax=Streptomyces sp. NPDC001982 TaxID=3154405 RepID=UPI003320DC69